MYHSLSAKDYYFFIPLPCMPITYIPTRIGYLASRCRACHIPNAVVLLKHSSLSSVGTYYCCVICPLVYIAIHDQHTIQLKVHHRDI